MAWASCASHSRHITSVRGARSVPMNLAKGSDRMQVPKPRPFLFLPTLQSKGTPAVTRLFGYWLIEPCLSKYSLHHKIFTDVFFPLV